MHSRRVCGWEDCRRRKIDKGYCDEHFPMSRKNAKLKHLYGITLRQYEAMLEAQNGVCAICGGVNDDGKMLAVDHCHETGSNRQLLCKRCNLGLGYFRDNPALLLRAATYLAGHWNSDGTLK